MPTDSKTRIEQLPETECKISSFTANSDSHALSRVTLPQSQHSKPDDRLLLFSKILMNERDIHKRKTLKLKAKISHLWDLVSELKSRELSAMSFVFEVDFSNISLSSGFTVLVNVVGFLPMCVAVKPNRIKFPTFVFPGAVFQDRQVPRWLINMQVYVPVGDVCEGIMDDIACVEWNPFLSPAVTHAIPDHGELIIRTWITH